VVNDGESSTEVCVTCGDKVITEKKLFFSVGNLNVTLESMYSSSC
jgi:hypothetical protein